MVSEIKNIAYLVCGTLLISLGVVLFLAPNQVATGGTPGMAILLNALFESFSIGFLMVLVNIPLLIVGMKYIGKSFGIRTIAAIVLVAVFTDVFRSGLRIEPVSHEMLLATLFGGVIVGLGAGLVLRGNGSAGGSTVLARILSVRFGIKPGKTILAVDAFIICSSALVFHNIEQSLWSLISIYVTSRCIDMVLTGGPSGKVVHIVTDKVDVLSREIVEHLTPDGTIVRGEGIQEGNEKTMLFVTVEPARITRLREIVREHDPKAFMIVMDAAEMLGRGH